MAATLISPFEFLVSGDVTPSGCGGLSGEAEIDLLFEGVHFGDLDFDAVAQADDAAGAAADEVVASGFEDEEVIDER